MSGKIPVTVLVLTRNNAPDMKRCLEALRGFDEIVVVDSHSTDETAAIARKAGARVENFTWNGGYPKKRQWCLDNFSFRNDWVFSVDADEVVTPELVAEIAALPFDCAGYFVRGLYVMDGKILRHGLSNNKIALLDRRRMEFPVINDSGVPGMGEIEGHYQPVLKRGCGGGKIGRLRAPLLHYAHDDPAAWEARHRRYAAWEQGMNARNAWPADPVPWRQALKKMFRAAPARPAIAFLYCYFFKFGFLDGAAGFRLAAGRYRYYRMIAENSKPTTVSR